MATYTINTTAAQDAGIAHMLAQANAQRAQLSLPPLTADQFVQAMVAGNFAEYAATRRGFVAAQLQQSFEGAPPAVQAQVKATLGF